MSHSACARTVLWQLLLALALAGQARAAEPATPAAAPPAGPPPAAQGPRVAPVDPYVHRSNFVVSDIDRELKLYRDVLGFKVGVMMPVKSDYMAEVFNIDHAAKMRIAFLSSPDNRFGVIGMTEVKGVPLPPQPSSYSSALIVEVKGRFEKLYEQVKAIEPKLEVSKTYELEGPARREFLITDYDGHRILIMQLRAGD